MVAAVYGEVLPIKLGWNPEAEDVAPAWREYLIESPQIVVQMPAV
jgi:hypothetical protein